MKGTLSSNEFLELAGLTKHTNGYEYQLDNQDAWRKLATRVIADLQAKKINTRRFNQTTSPELAEYLTDLHSLLLGETASTTAPNGRSGWLGPEDREVPASDAPSPASPSAAPSPLTNYSSWQATWNKFPIDGLVPWSDPEPYVSLFREFAEIRIDRYPNASMDLLRTFLEKSIKLYSHKIQYPIRVGKKPYVQLNDCLHWLEDLVSKDTENKATLQPVRNVRAKTKDDRWLYHGSQDFLNAINHNYNVVASPADVRNSWNAIEPLIRYMFDSAR